MLITIPVWVYIVVIFIVTSLYDGLLQWVDSFAVLREYFAKYGGITAMALAGACGLVAVSFAQLSLRPKFSMQYILGIAGISAGVGLAMKYGNYAPPLNTTYYGQPLRTTVPLDGLSGVIVVSTTLLLFKVR